MLSYQHKAKEGNLHCHSSFPVLIFLNSSVLTYVIRIEEFKPDFFFPVVFTFMVTKISQYQVGAQRMKHHIPSISRVKIIHT